MEKRKKIGVFVANAHMDHPKKIIRSIYRYFEDKKVDVHFLLGTESGSFYHGLNDDSTDFDYQYLSMFDYAFFEDFDLLIIAYGSLNTFQMLGDKRTFLDKFKSIPCIILEDNCPPEIGINLIADNYTGMKQCVEHLIKEHGYKDIVYLSGPENNDDSSERLQAYLDAMIENGLPVDDNMIEYGDFSEDVDKQVYALFENNEHIDAIVSANDEMSTTIYQICERKGLKVGKDIAVTGFDNMRFAWCAKPGLTTVEQKSSAMGKRAGELAMDFLNGKKVDSDRIPTKFIIRGSCGCNNTNRAAVSREENKMEHAIEEMRETWSQAVSGPMSLREMIQVSEDETAFYTLMAQMLIRQGAKFSRLYLQKNPMVNVKNTPCVMSDELDLIFDQNGADFSVYGREHATEIHRGEGLIPKHEADEDSHLYFSYLLFDGNRQYGILTTEVNYKEVSPMYLYTLEIGTALHFRELTKRSTEDRERMLEQNAKLNMSASIDPLTGLLNRRGVTEAIGRLIAINEGQQACVFIGDLDHLKEINDTFGHGEGDFAINAAGQLLRRVAGDGSPLGRIGGDEFLGVFLIDDGLNAEEEMKRRVSDVKLSAEIFNTVSGKPYYLGVSVGAHIFTCNSGTAIKDLMKMADEKLYVAKKSRRATVTREKAENADTFDIDEALFENLDGEDDE